MTENATNKNALILGFFSSIRNPGKRDVCEDLAQTLETVDWNVITASSYQNRMMRLLDIIQTIIFKRKRYNVVQQDLFSGRAFWLVMITTWFLRRLNKPYIYTLHGGLLPTFSAKYPNQVRHLLNSAKVVTAPSKYLLEQMKPYCDNIVYLPNPINLTAYTYKERISPAPKLIWLRSFQKTYNPEMALHVVNQLREQYADIHLTMVGPDKGDGTFQKVEALIQKLNIEPHVTLTGGIPKEDVPLWLNKGDIFINTTNADNTPISVMEAMASGLPVVSTNVGGIPYLLEDDKTALLVQPNDTQAMIHAIERILTEQRLAEKLSYNGRKEAEQWDWKNLLPQWEALLQQAL